METINRVTDPAIGEGDIVTIELGGFARTVVSVDGDWVTLEDNSLFPRNVIHRTDIAQIIDLASGELGGTIYRVDWS